MAMTQIVDQNIDILMKGIEKLGYGVYVISPFKKKFNFFAYLGFGEENFYMFETALTNQAAQKFQTKVNAEAVNNLSFRPLGDLEGTMSEDGVSVHWYEQGIFNTRSRITADTSTTEILVEDPEMFAIDQLVSIIPLENSTGVESTVRVTAIDVSAKKVTVDNAVSAKQDDFLLLTQQLQEVGKATTGNYNGLKSDKLRSVFGKFGAELEFFLHEINTTRFFTQADTYIKNKVSLTAIKLYNDMANAWFKGTNTAGNKPVPEGIDHVISQREAAGLKSIYEITGADEKEKLNNYVDLLDQAAQSPVYRDEQPTVIMNLKFKSKFSKSLRDLDIQMNNGEGIGALKYGLRSVSSPFVSDVEGIIVEQMNNIYMLPTAFVIPKHLITFKQPMYTLVSKQGETPSQEVNSPGRILIFHEPQVTSDRIAYHLEYYCANIFGGMTYNDSYMRLTWK